MKCWAKFFIMEKCICSGIQLPKNDKCCGELKEIKHLFKNGKYYRDDKYFGDIIFSDGKIIQVECKNGNKYMHGQIITMRVVG